MVLTRSQEKLMIEKMEEPQVTGESRRDVRKFLMDKVLDKMEEFSSEMALLMVENAEIRHEFTKLEEAYDNLKLRYDYTKWQYTKLLF